MEMYRIIFLVVCLFVCFKFPFKNESLKRVDVLLEQRSHTHI